MSDSVNRESEPMTPAEAAAIRAALVAPDPTSPRSSDQADTEWVPWGDAIGRTLVSGDLIAQVRRMAAVQHPGPYPLYVEMWSQNHECWCRPVLDDHGRVEVMRQPECVKCGDDATMPCECTPEVSDDIDPGDQPDTPCPHCNGARLLWDPASGRDYVPCPACTPSPEDGTDG